VNVGAAPEVSPSALCWFCQSRQSNPPDAATVKMHANVMRQGNHVQWSQLEVIVPRCGACKVAHDKVSRATSIGLLLGLIVSVPIVISIWTALFPSGYDGPVLIPLWLGGWVLYLVPFIIVALPIAFAGAAIGGLFLPKGTNGEETKTSFPAVQSKIIEGWIVGKKPKLRNSGRLAF